MRIVMLTNAVAPDKLGGLERYVRELAEALQARGDQVLVIGKRVRPELPLHETGHDGVITARYRVPSKRNPLFVPLYPLVVAADVRRLLRRAGAGREDVVVHVHHPVPALVPMLLGVPYVYTFHAPVWREILPERHDAYFLPAPLGRAGVALFRRMEGLLLRRARLVITLSRFVRDEAIALGVDPARHRLVPGGIDGERFRPAGSPAGGPEGPRLFTARRLVDRMGIDQLIEAMPAILAALPGARLRIAGSGARRERLEALIERLGLREQVRLLGRIPDADLVEEYRAADLVVTPTQELEGFGLTTAEALASGTAALVTPVGANAEVVEGLSELLVSSDRSPSAIADAVVALFAQPAELTRIRGAARDHVLPRFGWDSVAERYATLYGEATGASDAAPGRSRTR
ncbi:glycosyltransferase family 4 protein [Amnibacterium endophyticum]|uniref:D-inositol 3-phosphate glycosyltransferase n=1 Tax=Amnibacterium endophyticum TaxID=2109337 RepID=A0ABW4L9E8_9MICO